MIVHNFPGSPNSLSNFESSTDLTSDSDTGTNDGSYTLITCDFQRLRSQSQRIHAKWILSYENTMRDFKNEFDKLNVPNWQGKLPQHCLLTLPMSNISSSSSLFTMSPKSTAQTQSVTFSQNSLVMEAIDDHRDSSIKFKENKEEKETLQRPENWIPEGFRYTDKEDFNSWSDSKPIVETTRVKKVMSSSQKRYINQYLLEERIGRGTTGSVRKCKDITTGITYAMKILNKSNLRQKLTFKLTKDDIVQRCCALDNVEQEIAIMKALRHRNIVNLIEVVNSENVLYLILEYMPHGSLAKGGNRIKKIGSNDGEKDLLRVYMRHMVSGLAYLHSQRICHSDIKPENILIGENNTLKLADFGLSKYIGHGQSSKVFQEKDGTPAFTAPECFSDDALKFSMYPTDIWALGVTLYQLKYGFLPFWSEDTETLMDIIVSEPVKFPMSEKDKDFKDLIKALLHKNPSKRIKMLELCQHPWVTARGKYPSLENSYIRNLVTMREQRAAVSTLINISSNSTKEDSDMESEAKSRPRSSTDYNNLLLKPTNIVPWELSDSLKAGENISRSLEVIAEKSSETILLYTLPSPKFSSTRSLFGCQVIKSNSGREISGSLEQLVGKDLDVSANPPNRSVSQKVTKSARSSLLRPAIENKGPLSIKKRHSVKQVPWLKRRSGSGTITSNCRLAQVHGVVDTGYVSRFI